MTPQKIIMVKSRWNEAIDRMKKKFSEESTAENAQWAEAGAEDQECEVEVNDAQDVDQASDEQAEAEVMEEPTQEQWRAALTQAVVERDEHLEQVKRVQAEFINFRRRNEKTRSEGYDDGVREAAAVMLTTLDNLERALEAAKASGEEGALLEGVEMTYRQFEEGFKKLGVEEIPALGEPFDPEVHNAVMRAEEGEPGTVLEVFQKGYRVKGRVIRYAMVKVAAE